MIALRENADASTIRQSHFTKAMKKVRPSLNKDILRMYERDFKMEETPILYH